MENPIAAVKSGFSINKIIGVAVGFIIVAAILDLAGLTNWLLQPVSTARAKFSKSAA